MGRKEEKREGEKKEKERSGLHAFHAGAALPEKDYPWSTTGSKVHLNFRLAVAPNIVDQYHKMKQQKEK